MIVPPMMCMVPAPPLQISSASALFMTARPLLIAGGGLFPTAGGGSPTFTILALAERSAEMILHQGS